MSEGDPHPVVLRILNTRKKWKFLYLQPNKQRPRPGGKPCRLGMLVDKDDLINYQLQPLTLGGLLMIVEKVWKLTNTVRDGLDARSSHAQRQSSFPDN